MGCIYCKISIRSQFYLVLKTETVRSVWTFTVRADRFAWRKMTLCFIYTLVILPLALGLGEWPCLCVLLLRVRIESWKKDIEVYKHSHGCICVSLQENLEMTVKNGKHKLVGLVNLGGVHTPMRTLSGKTHYMHSISNTKFYSNYLTCMCTCATIWSCKRINSCMDPWLHSRKRLIVTR